MYIFTRALRLRPGNIREALGWGMEILEKVNQISEAQFSLWTPMFSPGVGTIGFVTAVDDLSVLESTNAKTMADDSYLNLVDKGAQHTTGEPVDDTLLQVVHGDLTRFADAQIVSVVEARLANGSFRRGLEVGVEIAQRAESLSGAPTAFGICATGPYAGVQWISAAADAAELQRGESAVQGDPSFLQYLDEDAKDVFVPASGEQRVLRRLA